MQKLFLAAVALCLTATLAHAAGLRFIEVPADADGPALKGAMWYPCAAPPGEIQLGPLTLPGVKDCPISGEKLPLVVVSHGMSGDFADHHDLAETLADAGFIVAAIDHPGHSSFDMSRAGDLSIWVERPTDTKRLIDFMSSTAHEPALGEAACVHHAAVALDALERDPTWRRPVQLLTLRSCLHHRPQASHRLRARTRKRRSGNFGHRLCRDRSRRRANRCRIQPGCCRRRNRRKIS